MPSHIQRCEHSISFSLVIRWDKKNIYSIFIDRRDLQFAAAHTAQQHPTEKPDAVRIFWTEPTLAHNVLETLLTHFSRHPSNVSANTVACRLRSFCAAFVEFAHTIRAPVFSCDSVHIAWSGADERCRARNNGAIVDFHFFLWGFLGKRFVCKRRFIMTNDLWTRALTNNNNNNNASYATTSFAHSTTAHISAHSAGVTFRFLLFVCRALVVHIL